MPAGTIVFTNGSNSVTGTGTTLTADVEATDFIIVVIGGTSYMVGVTSVESDTGLTLVRNFDGPTTGGLTYRVVPVQTMQLITSQLSADTSRAFRELFLDKSNWQAFYASTGDITITLPDGTSVTGPGWPEMQSDLSGKAGRGANSDITSLSGLTTALSIAQGGTGATTAATAKNNLGLGTTAIPFFASLELSTATPFIDFHYGSDTGDYNVRLINDASGTLKCMGRMQATFGYQSRAGSATAAGTKNNSWNFYWSDDNQLQGWVDTTILGAVSFTAVSDKLLKTDIDYKAESAPEFANNFLSEVMQWRVASFKYIARGVITESEENLGFIANDLVEVSPECVDGEGLKEGFDPLNPENAYSLNQIAMLAKLTGAIQAQQVQIEELKKQVEKLTGNSEPAS